MQKDIMKASINKQLINVQSEIKANAQEHV